MEPGEPARATVHRAGVADAEMSFQRRPDSPTMTTCGETAVPAWPTALAGLELVVVRTATTLAATARAPSRIRRANVPFTGLTVSGPAV